jgi:enoyl-CoA hydratase
MAELLNVKVEGHIAIITLDHPPLNLMTPKHLEEMISEFNRLGADEQISVVVLTGAGERAFCAGGDRRMFVAKTPQEKEARQKFWWDVESAIRDCAAPVIGAINGYAGGGGVLFAASCDILVVSERAVFDIPEINAGVLAPFWSLRRLLPELKVRSMAYTAQRLTAHEMQSFGCIEKVVAHEELMPTAMQLARRIAEKDSYTLRIHKEIFNKTEHLGMKESHALVMDYCRKLPGIQHHSEPQRDSP